MNKYSNGEQFVYAFLVSEMSPIKEEGKIKHSEPNTIVPDLFFLPQCSAGTIWGELDFIKYFEFG